MGCGRVGAWLATVLERRGHSVAVIDQNSDAFRRLPDSFEGRRVTGVGFDREALSQAGIEDAAGFAAVSSGDNSNIIAARVVRENFGISNVVARIYDPHRAQVYERLGVPTVATVRWAADQVLQRLLPMGPTAVARDVQAGVTLARLDMHESWYGALIDTLEKATEARVAYLVRAGEGIIPTRDTVIQANDRVFITARSTDMPHIQKVAATERKEAE